MSADAGGVSAAASRPPAAASAVVVAHPDPLSLLDSDDPGLAANKRLLFNFWRTALNAGHLEVTDEWVAENYIQHSPFQRSGRLALKETFAVIPRQDEIPDVMRPPPVAFVAEDDLVVFVAVEELPEPDGSGNYTTTHFNMFRIVDGRLAEHWHPDRTPPCPELPSAENGGPQPVTGLDGNAQFAMLEARDPQLAANKRLVFDMWRHVVDAGREAMAELYIADNYIEHSPNAARPADRERPIETSLRRSLVALVAERDLVVQVLKVELPNPYLPGTTYTTTSFDLFRIADGRIAEHWDAAVKPGTVVEELGSECEQAE
jgi:predicted SnoaL-like aldol condensation-catalyzing enzyme